MIQRRTIIFLAVYLVCAIFSAVFIIGFQKNIESITPKESISLSLMQGSYIIEGNKELITREFPLVSGDFNDKTALTISYDLRGVCLLPGLASAITLTSSNNKTYSVSLSEYGMNCAAGEQKVIIPISNFSVSELIWNINKISIQFWNPTTFSIEIKEVGLHTPGSIRLAEYMSYKTSAQIIAPLVTPTPTPTAPNLAPVAVATANITAGSTVPFPVEFRGYKSYDPEGKPLTYHWSLGDGNGVSDANANHTYFKTGTYTAQFSVSDGVNITVAAPITIKIGAVSTPTPTPTTTPTATPISDITPPVISSINVSNLSQFSATINWTTNEPADSQIEFPNGPCPNTSSCLTPVVTGTRTSHAINISNLLPNTTYNYQVKSRDQAGNLATSPPQSLTTLALAPTPTPSPTPISQSWPIRSVSSMKITKDVICSPKPQAFIDSWVSKAIELGVNYIAVETPYDSPACGDSVAYTKAWVDTIHARGLNVWHRHMPLAFEGIYNSAKNPSLNYIALISNYITANPTFFKAGDIFTPIPEPQNGGIQGITYCPQSICIFPSASAFNAWLRDAMTNSENAFTTIGLGAQIKIGYYGFDGFVAWGDNNPDWHGILETSTIQAMGNITIDHYPELVSDTMENDLNELQARYPGIPIVIGEWGTVTPTDLVGQVNRSMAAALRPGVVGFNYWHMGPDGNEALINSDFTRRIQYDAVKSFFVR